MTDKFYPQDRPFARSDHMVRNKLCWDANNEVGVLKQMNTYQSRSQNVYFETLRYLRPSIICPYHMTAASKGPIAEVNRRIFDHAITILGLNPKDAWNMTKR